MASSSLVDEPSGHAGTGPSRRWGSVVQVALSSLRSRRMALGSGGGPERALAPPAAMFTALLGDDLNPADMRDRAALVMGGPSRWRFSRPPGSAARRPTSDPSASSTLPRPYRERRGQGERRCGHPPCGAAVPMGHDHGSNIRLPRRYHEPSRQRGRPGRPAPAATDGSSCGLPLRALVAPRMGGHVAVLGVTIHPVRCVPSLARADDDAAVAARCWQGGSDARSRRLVGAAVAALRRGAEALLVDPLAGWAAGALGEPAVGTHGEPDGGGVAGPHRMRDARSASR